MESLFYRLFLCQNSCDSPGSERFWFLLSSVAYVLGYLRTALKHSFYFASFFTCVFEKLPCCVYNNSFYDVLGHKSVSDLIKQFYAIRFYRCNIVSATLIV